jgi:hypothetical protein
VGGLLFSMFLTLMLVPVVYTYLARWAPARPKDVRAEEPAMIPGAAVEPARPK